ncbi:YndJ family protein [Kribbella sp. NBC_01510]|uniref:YndJ family transporter n=1 Tax=Kribbella sp. NBC_01510 TaxID=2903581 RepID=UPI00386BE0AF
MPWLSLGMLVVVPLGLTLLPTRTTSPRWWFAFAVPGVISLWLPRGAVSITLAAIYLAGTLVLITLAARHFLHHKVIRPREIALYTALATPSIAALALVAERSSYELFGFNLTVLSLTVAHFHFAGFATAPHRLSGGGLTDSRNHCGSNQRSPRHWRRTARLLPR